MNAVATRVINGLLSIKPLANFAKNRARTMMMDRAETLGVYWRKEVKELQRRGTLETSDSANNGSQAAVNPIWEQDLAAVTNPDITYPAYYTVSFHAYEEGNLGWLPAMEVDVAARTVHAQTWPEGDERAGVRGDEQLRRSYHQVLQNQLPAQPKQIIDLGSSAGSSTFALKETFPAAEVTGVELSPYFVAVAQYIAGQRALPDPHPADPAHTTTEKTANEGSKGIRWLHALAEDTGLPAESADLVSACLVFHELPLSAAQDIIAEAYRLVRPGGHFAIMDMNPECDTFVKMPPYVLTILKSTEPYLDQYFALKMDEAYQAAGFMAPRITINSPRHRTVIGQKPLA